MSHSGRCLCGAVRYELAGEIGALVNCHCQYCRRAHGAAFVTTTLVATRDLHFVAGEQKIARYEGRYFCSLCGTRLFNRSEAYPAATVLVVCSLDENLVRAPVAHFNVESKAAWYHIPDDAPQHQGFPPEVDAALDRASGLAAADRGQNGEREAD